MICSLHSLLVIVVVVACSLVCAAIWLVVNKRRHLNLIYAKSREAHELKQRVHIQMKKTRTAILKGVSTSLNFFDGVIIDPLMDTNHGHCSCVKWTNNAGVEHYLDVRLEHIESIEYLE